MHTALMEKHPDPWYKHRWPWLLMAGPVAVLIAGFITMWISFSGADALVVDDYYKQGKAINQDLRRDRAAASLGLSLSLRYDAAAGKLVGQLQGVTDGAPLNLLLVHPTVPEKDIRLVAVPDSSGVFSVAIMLRPVSGFRCRFAMMLRREHFWVSFTARQRMRR